MEDSHEGVQDGGLEELRPGHRQNVPDQHLLQVLGLLGRLGHQEDRHGGRDDIDDADDRFLRNARLAMDPRDGEDRRAQEGEPEREEVRPVGVQVVPRQVGHGRPERGDLGQRQVDENDAALDDVHPEIGVDSGQDQAGDESR